MARQLRIEYPGAVYHIAGRGNARQAVYLNDNDRQSFLDLLQKVNKRFNWLCHAYCLMDNHYHLVLETPDANLSSGMRQLGGVYTQTFNRRNDRVGHLFQGRYKAILVEKESHLLELCRYVVLNPVRSGMERFVAAWPWSSYRATVGLEVPHPCLSTDWVLGQFGSQQESAQRKYQKFVAEGVGREGIWQDLKGQILLGRADFADKLSDLLKGQSQISEIPRRQRVLGRPLICDLFDGAARSDKTRRNLMIVEAVATHGYSQSDVAAELGLHYSTISQVVNSSLKSQN